VTEKPYKSVEVKKRLSLTSLPIKAQKKESSRKLALKKESNRKLALKKESNRKLSPAEIDEESDTESLPKKKSRVTKANSIESDGDKTESLAQAKVTDDNNNNDTKDLNEESSDQDKQNSEDSSEESLHKRSGGRCLIL